MEHDREKFETVIRTKSGSEIRKKIVKKLFPKEK